MGNVDLLPTRDGEAGYGPGYLGRVTHMTLTEVGSKVHLRVIDR